MNTSNVKPFIIWTLQRTGGTNLTQRLVELAGLPATQHEPFNLGRMYGEITQAWMDTHDEAVLACSMQDVIARRSIIKHCVEMVPWEVTRSLAKEAVQADYCHLFLYREHARDRLLSLHFAQKTGVWGPDLKKGDIPEEALKEAIPIERMLRHEENCVTRLGQTWRFLIEQGVFPQALSYEEIYRVTPEVAKNKLQSVLERLGLARSPQEDHAFVLDVLSKGNQGTRDKYQNIPGVKELEEALRGVSAFVSKMQMGLFSVQQAQMPDWVVRAQIDSLPKEKQEGGCFVIGGVLVVDKNAPDGLVLQLSGSNGPIEIHWDIESPKMKKLHPDAKNSRRARFRSAEVAYVTGKEIFLQATDAEGNVFPILKGIVL